MVLTRSSGGPDPEKLRRLEIREKYPILRSACTRRLVRVHDELRRAHVPPVHCDERLLRPSCVEDPVDKNYPQRHHRFPYLFHDFVIPHIRAFKASVSLAYLCCCVFYIYTLITVVTGELHCPSHKSQTLAFHLSKILPDNFKQCISPKSLMISPPRSCAWYTPLQPPRVTYGGIVARAVSLYPSSIVTHSAMSLPYLYPHHSKLYITFPLSYSTVQFTVTFLLSTFTFDHISI